MRFPRPILMVVAMVLADCGGPNQVNQATMAFIAKETALLTDGITMLQAGKVPEATMLWYIEYQKLPGLVPISIDNATLSAQLEPILVAYQRLLNAHAAEWLARYEDDSKVINRLLVMAKDVNALEVGRVIAQRASDRAKALADRKAEDARRLHEEHLASIDGMPRSLLVSVRASPDMPKALEAKREGMIEGVIAALKQHLEGVTVLRRTADMPLGIEGCAGGELDLIIGCEYAAYGNPEEATLAIRMDTALPTKLSLRLVSRRGRTFDIALVRSIEATMAAPGGITRAGAATVAAIYADQLVAEVMGKLPKELPAFDLAALHESIAVAPAFHWAQAPLVLVTSTCGAGPDNDPSQENVYESPSVELLRGALLTLIARRIGPVRVTQDETAAVDATIAIESTAWYRIYGTHERSLMSNDFCLPYRDEVMITMSATGATALPWTGAHRFSATTTLPTEVSAAGGCLRASLDAVEAFIAQIDAQFASQGTVVANPHPGITNELDHYLLEIVPLGDFDNNRVISTSWYRALTSMLRDAVAAHLAPDVIVRSDHEIPGRTLGTVTVFVRGGLAAPIGMEVGSMGFEPSNLRLHCEVKTASGQPPHGWEGLHDAKIELNHAEILDLKRKKIEHPCEAVIAKGLASAWP